MVMPAGPAPTMQRSVRISSSPTTASPTIKSSPTSWEFRLEPQAHKDTALGRDNRRARARQRDSTRYRCCPRPLQETRIPSTLVRASNEARVALTATRPTRDRACSSRLILEGLKPYGLIRRRESTDVVYEPDWPGVSGGV